MAKVAAVSGYKSFELGIFQQSDKRVEIIKTALKKNIHSLLEEGYEWILISGELGTELWAAEAVFSLKEEGFEELKLAVITPFLHQEKNWNERNKEWYNSVLQRADYVNSVSKKPYMNPWQYRQKNKFFIEKSDLLLLLYDPEFEGSPKYIYEAAKKYQQKHNYEIRLFHFYDLQELFEEEQMRREPF